MQVLATDSDKLNELICHASDTSRKGRLVQVEM